MTLGPGERANPYLVTVWNDASTGVRGYFVVDRLINGHCSGGIRMRVGVTEQEVRDLARTMSYKMAVLDVPYGGAKSGIDCDPAAPFAKDVLRRFLIAIRPYVAERYATGADLGTHEDDIVAACQMAGLTHPLQAGFRADGGAGLSRVRQALALTSEGVAITELIAGYGVAECALEAASVLGLPVAGMTVSLQGFGNVGGAAARYLHRAGARIIAVADIEGTILSENGLDVPSLLEIRDRLGHIDRDRLPPGTVGDAEQRWRSVEADLVIPAALGGVIAEENQSQVRCRLLVEAANNPVTAAAECGLEANGITVLPDFVANAAAAFFSCGLLEGHLEPTLDSIFSVTSRQLRRITREMLERAQRDHVGTRVAAEAIAEQRLLGHLPR